MDFYELGYYMDERVAPTTQLEYLYYQLGKLDARSDLLEMGDNTELYNNDELQQERQKLCELINDIKKGDEIRCHE